MLRHTVAMSVEDTGIWVIAALAQRLHDSNQNRAVIPPRHVGHVLQQDESGSEVLDDLDEASPQLRPAIDGLSLSRRYEAADLRAAGTGEGLARWAPCNDLRLVNSSVREKVDEVGRIGEVSTESKWPQIGILCPQSRRVRIGGGNDREPRPGQTEAEASGPTKQINRPWPGLRLQPAFCGGRVSGWA
jgi:hypothetical protein